MFCQTSTYKDNTFHSFGCLKGLYLGNEPSVTEKIEKEETLIELAECLDKLPGQWKGIMSSKYLEEKESEQICNDFDITPSNLWVIIHRAKLLMRDCLQTKWKK